MKGLSEAGYQALEAELIAEARQAEISSTIAEAITNAIEIELIAELEVINHWASEEEIEAYERWRRTSDYILANGEDRGVWPGRAR